MIVLTWNDFSDTVKKNLLNQYGIYFRSPLYASDPTPSVVGHVWRDHDLVWYSNVNDRGGLSFLEFTDEQYTMFMLRWA